MRRRTSCVGGLFGSSGKMPCRSEVGVMSSGALHGAALRRTLQQQHDAVGLALHALDLRGKPVADAVHVRLAAAAAIVGEGAVAVERGVQQVQVLGVAARRRLDAGDEACQPETHAHLGARRVVALGIRRLHVPHAQLRVQHIGGTERARRAGDSAHAGCLCWERRCWVLDARRERGGVERSEAKTRAGGRDSGVPRLQVQQQPHHAPCLPTPTPTPPRWARRRTSSTSPPPSTRACMASTAPTAAHTPPPRTTACARCPSTAAPSAWATGRTPSACAARSVGDAAGRTARHR